ncbi:MAG: beta-ketoacyl synthase N-terminal-like domain-containing protein [Bryobacterales bacterium]
MQKLCTAAIAAWGVQNCCRTHRSSARSTTFRPSHGWAKGNRALDRCARLLAVASHLALRNGGLLESPEADVGLAAGTMLGGATSIVEFDWSGITDGPSYVSPMGFANTVINAAAGQTAIKHQLRGVNSTISSGQSSGLAAIAYAARNLALGRAEYLLAGGVEELCPQTYEGLAANGLLATDGAARPFASDRTGLTLGEASALFLLETTNSLSKRGRTGLATIASSAFAQNAADVEGSGYPDPSLLARKIHAALSDAGIEREQIACLVLSGNGSKKGDAVEAEALQSVFGANLAKVPACAPKAAIGDTLGASSAFAAVVAALALERGCLPPTPQSGNLEYDLALSAQTQPIAGEYALVCSAGFYGDAAAMVLRSCR